MATKFRALIVTVQLRLKEIIYTVAIFRLQRYTQKGKKNNNCRFYFVTQTFKSYFTLIYYMFTFQYLHFEIILHRKIRKSD